MDHYTGNDFGAEEARSGYKADGGYTVLLPDGRKQVNNIRSPPRLQHLMAAEVHDSTYVSLLVKLIFRS